MKVTEKTVGQVFEDKVGEALSRIKELENWLLSYDDNTKNPNWADVGTCGHISEQLDDILEGIRHIR